MKHIYDGEFLTITDNEGGESKVPFEPEELKAVALAYHEWQLSIAKDADDLGKLHAEADQRVKDLMDRDSGL